MKVAVAMALAMLAMLGLNMWDSARRGGWVWFVLSLLEFWLLGGILFRMGVDRFMARKRREASKT